MKEALKIRLAATVLLPLVWLAAVSPAQAQDTQVVRCPADEITAEVVTALPREWQFAAQRGKLTDAQVRQVDGNLVLACLYQAYGQEIAVVRRPPEGMMSCRAQSTGDSFVCGAEEMPSSASELRGRICQASIQDQIEWDYEGRKRWARPNLENICQNAEHSLQPGACFKRVMHGDISHGSSSRWTWPNALRLCAGTQNAQSTIACFSKAIEQQLQWPEAIERCRVKF